MAAGKSWDGNLADDEGTAFFRSRYPMPSTLPFIGDDDSEETIGVGVRVSGGGVPEPAEGFKEAGLAEAVLQKVWTYGFETPTPLQQYLVPVVLAGRDLLACAPTGSGKTAAFCMSVVSVLLAERRKKDRGDTAAASVVYHAGPRPRALLLAPTEERARKIQEYARSFSYRTGLRVELIYGGTPEYKQEAYLEGVDMLIATPQALLAQISRLSLEGITCLVIDEADKILHMGYDRLIRDLAHDVMPGRQTLLFSATCPQELQKLASDLLSNNIYIAIGNVESCAGQVMQSIQFISDGKKRGHLLHLLNNQYVVVAGKRYQPLTLVFVETKREADSLRYWLCYKGFLATAIHGERTQQETESVLKSFKAGLTPILVATDAASRGLHIPNVAYVINYDLPKSIEDYVNRIRRTGRAGNAGYATSFFTISDHSLAKGLLELMTKEKQYVPNWLKNYVLTPRVRVDADGLHEKDELSHWMSQPIEFELEVNKDIYSIERMTDHLRLQEEEVEELTREEDEISYKQTIENGMKWMSEECFLCFRKHVEQIHFQDVQHKFGELCNQCFSVDVDHKKIFHHYNFTVETKHAGSDIWTSQFYFAEVKQLSDVKHYFCCSLKESDEGRCYGCKNQQMDHLKHPSKGGYEEGNPDIRWPFMDDTPDSDDSGDFDR